MKAIKFILSDLDGVIRHFNSARDSEIEQRHGLTAGALFATAFEKKLLTRAVTGLISDEAWRAEILEILSATYPKQNAIRAVQDWSSFPGKVDHQYLDFLKKRFPTLPLAVLTNGTSRLHQDLKTLGLKDHFFRIFNSAEIGICKPDQKVYLHVLNELNCKPHEVFFIDDSISHVNSARDLGINAYHYNSLEAFKEAVKDLL
jgi:HAD superfamily hydrolase (TIGR01509 family)